jgi:hypothetical protein
MLEAFQRVNKIIPLKKNLKSFFIKLKKENFSFLSKLSTFLVYENFLCKIFFIFLNANEENISLFLLLLFLKERRRK